MANWVEFETFFMSFFSLFYLSFKNLHELMRIGPTVFTDFCRVDFFFNVNVL
jgi:hypothetical protein